MTLLQPAVSTALGAATSGAATGGGGECLIHARLGLLSSLLHPWQMESYSYVATEEVRDAGVVGDFPMCVDQAGWGEMVKIQGCGVL